MNDPLTIKQFWLIGSVLTFCSIQRGRKDGELLRHYVYDFLFGVGMCWIAWPIFLGKYLREALRR